jgi:excisionase family DNA binding protein
LLGEHCAHRGTSLFFGRNEDCGLRCIYHGWKYDVAGHVLETPVMAAISEGTLKAKKIGSQYRITRAAIEAFLAE